MNSLHRHFRSFGFTLVEMLVGLAVLVILLVALGQMLNLTSSVIENSGGHMSSDSAARMVFDRLANDFGHMPKRYDVDYSFVAQPGNDRFFFYSEAPALLSAGAPSSLQNTMALIGYQINASSYQLERLGYALNWDQAGWSANHLTFPNAASTYAPDPMSTINDGGAGQWTSVLGNDGSSGSYHILADTVFRLEFCFLLKDGTYSTQPIRFQPPSSWSSTAAFFVSQATPPTPNNDSTQSFTVGSRWWDTTNNRAWICLQAAAGAAVWRPLGWDDVAGIVVAIALLDDGSRTILTAHGTSLSQAASQLADARQSDLTASPPKLMSTTWQAAVGSSSFPAAAGLPDSIAGQVRIYQRCIYLNDITNL